MKWALVEAIIDKQDAIVIFFQEVDAIIDKQGATVSAEIHGYIGNECVTDPNTFHSSP